MPNEPQRCRHIHTEGRQCGSPALRHEKLCYHHHAARRPTPRDPLGAFLLPDPEDLHAVQRGLAELLRLTARELIDAKQAKRLFAILSEAGINLARLDRARARDRELSLRHRALVLAEARFAARHPEAAAAAGYPTETGSPTQAGCPPAIGCPTFATVSSSLRWASTTAQPGLVTELINDTELGPIAPGPNPEPAPEPAAEPTPNPTPAGLGRHPERSEGPRASPPRHNPSPVQPGTPQPPEPPTRARQFEIEAAAQAEAAFQRREEENREQRRLLRLAAEEVRHRLLTPAARARDNAARAAEDGEYSTVRYPPPDHQPDRDPPLSPSECEIRVEN